MGLVRELHFVMLMVLDLTVHHVDQVSEAGISNSRLLISFLVIRSVIFSLPRLAMSWRCDVIVFFSLKVV